MIFETVCYMLLYIARAFQGMKKPLLKAASKQRIAFIRLLPLFVKLIAFPYARKV